MSQLQALLWDVDGTMAETERDGHRIAFNRAFETFGLPWRWDEARYGELLSVSGGRERLLHDMAHRADAPSLAGERVALARALHTKKNALYADLVADTGVPLRPGVLELMREAREQGLRMAIATTTSRSNLQALLSRALGRGWADNFAAIVCGEDVQHKKPDPEVYVRALQQLRLGPLQTIAIEDSPGGAAAARTAGCPVVVTRSLYFAASPIDGAIAIGPGLHTRVGWRPALPTAGPDRPIGLADLTDWFALHDTVCEHPSP